MDEHPQILARRLLADELVEASSGEAPRRRPRRCARASVMRAGSVATPCDYFAGLAQRQPHQRVERRFRAQLVLRGVDRGAGFGRLEAEVGEGGQGVCGGAAARRGGAPPRPVAELALKLIGDARGELGADAVGAADHRLVVLATARASSSGDSVDRIAIAAARRRPGRGQGAEGVALAGRAEAEQGPGILAHLELGQDQHVAADRRRARRASGRSRGADSRRRRRRSPRCRRSVSARIPESRAIKVAPLAVRPEPVEGLPPA